MAEEEFGFVYSKEKGGFVDPNAPRAGGEGRS